MSYILDQPFEPEYFCRKECPENSEFQQKTENFLVLAFIGLSPNLHCNTVLQTKMFGIQSYNIQILHKIILTC